MDGRLDLKVLDVLGEVWPVDESAVEALEFVRRPNENLVEAVAAVEGQEGAWEGTGGPALVVREVEYPLQELDGETGEPILFEEKRSATTTRENSGQRTLSPMTALLSVWAPSCSICVVDVRWRKQLFDFASSSASYPHSASFHSIEMALPLQSPYKRIRTDGCVLPFLSSSPGYSPHSGSFSLLSLSFWPSLELHSFACYSLAFSPFYPAKLAIAGAANFGLVGNGRLSIVNQDGGPPGAQGGGIAMEKGCVDFPALSGEAELTWLRR
jgi:hypothetical protein